MSDHSKPDFLSRFAAQMREANPPPCDTCTDTGPRVTTLVVNVSDQAVLQLIVGSATIPEPGKK